MKRIGGYWYINGYGRPFPTLKEAIQYKMEILAEQKG